ncbi:unnamed protein product [Pleuronectes platessa]|uniref:Uncharacterized protein n=1 Tax=Pleuronectes platessa TaxID=8262 RepID=A0A9N7VAF9_PLEPL|nr:unnamed protein product [Pleuronectes platessa]
MSFTPSCERLLGEILPVSSTLSGGGGGGQKNRVSAGTVCKKSNSSLFLLAISSICLLGIIYSGIEGETKHICRLIPVQDNGGRITTKESYSLNPQRPHFPLSTFEPPLAELV